MQPEILFDSRSSQVLVDYQTGTRLSDLYNDLAGNNWTYAFSPTPSTPGGQASSITAEILQGYNVLCILTRLDQNSPSSPKGAPYPENSNPPPYYSIFPSNSFQYDLQEITAIQDWVSQGNGLLLMSDHGPMPTNVKDNQTINDCQLAAAFGIVLAPAFFSIPGSLIEMSGSCLNTAAFESNILQNVTSIAVHDCGAIVPLPQSADNVQTIAWLPAGLKNTSPINGFSPDGLPFAILITWGKGKVIIAGNSGMTGNTTHPYPAQGLYYNAGSPHGPPMMPFGPPCPTSYLPPANNAAFVGNCIGYLGGWFGAG